MIIKTFTNLLLSSFIAWTVFHCASILIIFITEDDPFFRSLSEEVLSITISCLFLATVTTILGLAPIAYLKKADKGGFWPYFRFSLYISFVMALYFYNAFRQVPIDAPPPDFFDSFVWREGFGLFYLRIVFPVAFLTPFIFWLFDRGSGSGSGNEKKKREQD